MAHSPELIQQIICLLQKDYPPAQYAFVIEKSIPGTRMLPDVQVFDHANNLVCVAEIGYTRPEKLTAYRKKHKIPDVRWYDKQGKLHADVQERVVRVTIDTDPRGTFSVFELHDQVECRSEICECDAVMEWNMAIEKIAEPMTEAEEFELYDDVVLNFLCECVDTFLITDYSRVWFFSFCDKCGDTWISHQSHSINLEAAVGELEDSSAGEFARAWGHRVFRGNWTDVKAWVEKFGETLIYEDGDFLSDRARRSFRDSMADVRVQASRMN